MTFKVHFLTLAAALALGQPLLAIQCVWAGEITTTELVSLLRDAKIVSATNRLTVGISGREVTVMTKRAGKLTDDDCKINSILMAKTVMSSYPSISRVKVMYAVEGSDSCDQVVVRTGDVKSFDSGAVTEEQLLSSLELQRVSGDQLTGESTGSSQVAAGAYRERRLMLWSRIDELRNAGTGVGPFVQSFNKIEDMIKANNSKEAKTALDALARNLTEQEKLRRQAQKVSAGQGVRGASLQRSNTSASLPATAAAPTGPIASAPLSDVEKQTLMNNVQMTQEHLNKMRTMGIDVADFENKIRDVQNSVQKRCCTARQELTELQTAMNQRCQGRMGPGLGRK
jgi:hypothetical protein